MLKSSYSSAGNIVFKVPHISHVGVRFLPKTIHAMHKISLRTIISVSDGGNVAATMRETYSKLLEQYQFPQ